MYIIVFRTYDWHRLTKSLSVVLGLRPRMYKLVLDKASPELWLLDWLLVVLGLAAGMLRAGYVCKDTSVQIFT